MHSEELKLLFAGPMGAGKTTAIRSISESAPILTEARNSDLQRNAKAETTVAFDYGEVTLEGGEKLRLYGMPGQSRFDFMWSILSDGALGVVILTDNSVADPIGELATFIEAFTDLASRAAVVVGVGRFEAGTTTLDDYGEWLSGKGLPIPVLPVDVRRRDDVLLLLDALIHQIEIHEHLEDLTGE